MRCVIYILSAFTLLSASNRTIADDSPELRVMSFNIRNANAKDGDNAWPHRCEVVAQTISKFQPDLLGTQETLPLQADYLEKQLPDYTRIGWTRDQNENGEQCTIFYRTDRFDVLQSGQFWLSDTPDKKFTKSWDSSLPRIATWILLQDRKDNDRKLMFANTHFDHRGVEARLKSAQLIHDRASHLQGAPVILTGDFNCAEKSDPWKALTSSGLLRDTRRVALPAATDNEGTFNGFGSDGGTRRIDWILVSEHFDVESAEIDRTNKDGRFPSDHFPVTAVLKHTR